MISWFRRKKKEPEPEHAAVDRDEGSPEESSPVETEEEKAAGLQTEAVEIGAAEPEGELDPGVEADAAVEAAEEEAFAFDEREEGLTDEDGSAGSAVEEEERDKGRFFMRLRDRLHRSREQFADRVDRLVLGRKTIDMDLLDELEEVLITSDLGVRTTQLLLQRVAEKVKRKELSDPGRLREQLRDFTREILTVPSSPWDPRSTSPFVVMIIGVNGVGKTTTIGKLAHQLKDSGLDVMLVAADTFRAAAIEQLTIWGERVGAPVIRQKSGSDPSAVAYDAIDAAGARHAAVVLIDTAGRMHTKVNLMEELKKIQRVIKKKMPMAPHEILLVLDATTGQNALSQARLFKDEIGITGVILTKLDGTAKGGIVVSICDELQVPVRFIGIGESVEDLRPFDPDEFTRALF